MGSPQRALVTPEFYARLREVREAAQTDDRSRDVYADLARMIVALEDGTENGHHALTDKHARGEGDLRDCTVSEFGFAAGVKRGDFRLLWRQLPPQPGSELPARELVHVGRRNEKPEYYGQALAVLERSPSEQLAENAAFGDPAYTGQKGLPSRSAALDTQRAAALAREGTTPLAKSRPLHEVEFGRRTAAPAAVPAPARSLTP